MFDVSLTRHLLRAEQARRDFYADVRLPEFLDQPTPDLKLRLEASIRIREGKLKEAADLLAQAEEKRARVTGTCDGQPFDDFRDLDDLTASFVEVLTTTGKYYWVPVERIELIEFKPAVRMRDLVWRSAHMVVTKCSCQPSTRAHIPATMNKFAWDARLNGTAMTKRRSGESVNACTLWATRIALSWKFRRLNSLQANEIALHQIDMALNPNNAPLQASVLDRLIHSESKQPAGRAPTHSLRDLKQSIRRDLENLLNTRWRCTSWPPNLNELGKSLIDYGIPDFSGSALGSSVNREEFRRIIERAIQRFEPRLRNVKVDLVESNEPLDRVLRFRINALVQADPVPEQVVFDSALEPLTSNFEVKGSGR
jgi:type VI secretion system lysozyme-like protein